MTELSLMVQAAQRRRTQDEVASENLTSVDIYFRGEPGCSTVLLRAFH